MGLNCHFDRKLGTMEEVEAGEGALNDSDFLRFPIHLVLLQAKKRITDGQTDGTDTPSWPIGYWIMIIRVSIFDAGASINMPSSPKAIENLQKQTRYFLVLARSLASFLFRCIHASL